VTRPAELIARAENLGAEFSLSNGDVQMRRPGGPLPQEMIDSLREFRSDVRNIISQRRFQYHFDDPDDSREFHEIVQRVALEGYVLLWSKVLEDFVAFHRDDIDPKMGIPPGFVPYSENELTVLFGKGSPDESENTLRLIHSAKKSGAVVTDRREK